MPWRREELAYCSNVHPGADLASVFANLDGPIAAVRRERGLPYMGCGLWLSAAAARELAPAPERLAERLAASGLFLFTLNGFPYGDFHRDRIKEAVYRPAWDAPERLSYTLDLARILARCLPSDQPYGSISTLPLGFAPDWGPARQAEALDNLCRLAETLEGLRGATGRRIRVCLEPEPGCVLETTDQAIALFGRDLPAAAARNGSDGAVLRDHLGLCYDVCHQAVMFEDAADSLARLDAAGVPIGKVQISSALEAADPRTAVPDGALARFVEPRYLHQVRAPGPDGRLRGAMDLEDLLAGREPQFARDEPWDPSPDRPWRIHFHVPIQTETFGDSGLRATSDAIRRVLDSLASRAGPTGRGPSAAEPRPHLEVETYTWELLPSDLRPRGPEGLVRGLAAELEWLEDRMEERGLLARPLSAMSEAGGG